MARRRHIADDHARHEAWAIPYGDLVTLMMAFFVVMYSVSIVDADKYRELSESLFGAFSTRDTAALIQVGDPVQGDQLIGDDVMRSLDPFAQLNNGGDLPLVGASRSPSALGMERMLDAIPTQERERILNEIKVMASDVKGALIPLADQDLIKIERQTWWLEVEINTSLLFQSGSATLEPAALPVLEQVAQVLARGQGRIHVEGHTDNLPIDNSIYPSNWELSSGRAATVVNLFAQNGVDPQRMVAIGYGEFQPVDSNETPEGRARNRRVAVVVLPGVPPRAKGEFEPERLRQDYEDAESAGGAEN